MMKRSLKLSRQSTQGFVLILLVGFIGCANKKGDEQVNESGQVVSYEVVNNGGQPTEKSVANGQSLSFQSLSTYFPESVSGAEGKEPQGFDAEPGIEKGHQFSMASKRYEGEAFNFTLYAYDYADNPEKLTQRMRKITALEDEYNQTVTTGDNLSAKLIKHKDVQNGVTVVNSETLYLINQRVEVSIGVTSTKGQELPEAEVLLSLLEKSNLQKLLNLPVQEVVSEKREIASLDCDTILPLSVVSSICQASDISLNITDFEKDSDCSRKYAYKGSLGGLILLISQYSEEGVAGRAVSSKAKDTTIKSRRLANPGERAVLQYLPEAYYLSISSGFYLIELRSTRNGLDAKDACCVCFSEEKLLELGEYVVKQL